MTLPETVRLLAVIAEAYPKFMDGRNIQTTATLWQKIFAEDQYREVEGALFAFISTDEKGFAPAPGALRAQLNKLRKPEGETTESEAWALVQKATRNSIYHADKEFAALPEDVQRCVGSAATLREWAVMDTETLNSVVASNFMRSYRARAIHVREIQALPQGVREVFGIIGDALKLPSACTDETKPLLQPSEAETPKTEPAYREPGEGWKLAKARIDELRVQRAREQLERNERYARQHGL